jgi:hypothetical protein
LIREKRSEKMTHHGGENGEDDDHVPHDDPEAKKQGEENRKEMDDIPPHGTDPLHEGP